jgi:hypothetical protein
MASKTQNIPSVTRTTQPWQLLIENGLIRVTFRTTSSIPEDQPEITENNYEGADFAALVTQDVGELLGGAAVGITLGQLAQNLAVRIAIDRGDESVGDWAF